MLCLLTAAVVLAVFIRPHFDTDLKAMNSVSRETRAADELMAAVWGDIFSSVYLMTEAPDLKALQAKNDRVLAYLETETHAGSIASAVTPSLFFPAAAADRRQTSTAWRGSSGPMNASAASPGNLSSRANPSASPTAPLPRFWRCYELLPPMQSASRNRSGPCWAFKR